MCRHFARHLRPVHVLPVFVSNKSYLILPSSSYINHWKIWSGRSVAENESLTLGLRKFFQSFILLL